MKFCIDCKHCNVIELHTRNDCYICLVKQESSRDMVTGKNATQIRHIVKICGMGNVARKQNFLNPHIKGVKKDLDIS